MSVCVFFFFYCCPVTGRVGDFISTFVSYSFLRQRIRFKKSHKGGYGQNQGVIMDYFVFTGDRSVRTTHQLVSTLYGFFIFAFSFLIHDEVDVPNRGPPETKLFKTRVQKEWVRP